MSELQDAYVMEELAHARLPECSRAEAKFLVEATSTRNEKLTTELTAEDALEAEQNAVLDFMCEGHRVVEVTVSELKGEGH
jgi:hypothetical protein